MRHKGECTGEVNRPPESSDAHSTTKVSFILRNCGLRSKTCSSEQSDPIRSVGQRNVVFSDLFLAPNTRGTERCQRER